MKAKRRSGAGLCQTYQTTASHVNTDWQDQDGAYYGGLQRGPTSGVRDVVGAFCEDNCGAYFMLGGRHRGLL